MTHKRTCPRCERAVQDRHRLCKICRKAATGGGGGDNDGPGPGLFPVQPESAGSSVNLTPVAERDVITA